MNLTPCSGAVIIEEMGPLAADVPLATRKTTLQALLARVLAARGAPAPAKTPAPVPEKIDAFDDRWGGPPATPALAKPAAAAAAPEKIDAFDDRWGSPPAPPPVVRAAAQTIKMTPITAVSGDRSARLHALLERVLKNGKR